MIYLYHNGLLRNHPDLSLFQLRSHCLDGPLAYNFTLVGTIPLD